MIMQAFYFALPIYLANAAPVLVGKLPWLNQPIDGGRLYRGQPLLGSHKTWKGLVLGTFIAILVVLVQSWASHYPFFAKLSLINYGEISAPLLGFLMGFGALAGDAAKSFLKRRLGFPPGSVWVPFDQLDFMIGGLALTSLYVWPGWPVALILFLLTPVLHYLTNLAAFKIGLKNVPW